MGEGFGLVKVAPGERFELPLFVLTGRRTTVIRPWNLYVVALLDVKRNKWLTLWELNPSRTS